MVSQYQDPDPGLMPSVGQPPAATRTFPLDEYDNVARYDEVCRQRFGRTYDLESLVRKFSALREPGHVLTAAHVLFLFNPEETHFGHFWRPPQDLEQTLNLRGISLAKPTNAGRPWREDLVGMMYEILGSVEAVSVLLRCTHPEDFAVYSPPTLNLLQLPAQPPVEHYLLYCDELRGWGAHFGAPSVAKTDQALWVFYEWSYGPVSLKVHGGGGEKGARARRRQFENDRWVRERQACNVLKPFFHQWSAIEQAACLAGIDPNLSGKIAGCELEKRLKQSTGLEDEEVPSLIQHFSTAADQDPGRRRKIKGRLRRAWKLRNKTVHLQGDLTPAEAEDMIAIIRDLLPDG
jgi:hypothetical protein